MLYKVLYGISELEYHTDTTFAGENCCIFKCTVKWGDVSPYCNGYEVIKCVPIVHVCVVLGLQAICHARILRRWSSNLGQWTIQP